MIQDKFKKIIFKKLYKDLSKAEIIPYKDGIWFIDREKKYWYLEYKRIGDLWWRHDFFENFFFMFCLNREDYEPIICEWVEEVLNYKVTTPHKQTGFSKVRVDEVLDCKVTTPYKASFKREDGVEDVLNCKVITSGSQCFTDLYRLEEVLNSNIP